MVEDEQEQQWTLYVDGLSNDKGSEARVILEDMNRVSIEQSL